MRRILALVFVIVLALSACTTSKEEEAASESAPATETADDGGASTPAPEDADDGAPAPEDAESGAPASDNGQQDQEEADGGDQAPDGNGAEPEVEEPAPTGPGTLGLFPAVVDERAPGVTDDAVKIGIMYPDLSEVSALIGIEHGDYEAAYRLAFDIVNNAGGIHGRMLVPVFAPVNPIGTDAGTAACTLLTEDENVFLAVGNFIGDDVLCFIQTHETPLLGTNISAENLALSRTLWYSTEDSESFLVDGILAMVRAGKLGGRVGVVGSVGNEELFETQIRPVLESGGVDVVGSAYLDTSLADTDPNAFFASAETIALKFESEGIDQVITIGTTESGFPVGVARTGYRPQIVFTNLSVANLYIGGEGNDLSVLEGLIGFGPFDSRPVFRQLGSPTAECVESQESELGITLLTEAEHDALEEEAGETVADDYPSSLTACRYTAFTAALLEAAGPTLNRGTLITAAHNLGEIMLPGFPDPWYFDKDHPSGIRPVLFYRWDAEAGALVPE